MSFSNFLLDKSIIIETKFFWTVDWFFQAGLQIFFLYEIFFANKYVFFFSQKSSSSWGNSLSSTTPTRDFVTWPRTVLDWIPLPTGYQVSLVSVFESSSQRVRVIKIPNSLRILNTKSTTSLKLKFSEHSS